MKCNEEKGICITYIGTPNTRDNCPLDPAQKNISREAPKTAEEIKAEMHSSVMTDYNTTKYVYTIIFAT